LPADAARRLPGGMSQHPSALCVISDFRRDVDETCALLVHCAS
jgi:hypothetical protein